MKKSKPLIAVSGCLLGQNVRYNRGHCQESWLIQELSNHVDFYPLCPEIEMGLGVPREEIHLYIDPKSSEVKLKSKFTDIELTEKAKETYKRLGAILKEKRIDGLILKSKSPTCGVDRVKTIRLDNPQIVTHTTGLFAKYAMKEFQYTPTIDSGRLNNDQLKESFIKSVFAHYRFTELSYSSRDFQDFHKRYKYILMDHSPSSLKKLGKIVALATKSDLEASYQKYYELFFTTLKEDSSEGKRVNTLQHIMGYFKRHISTVEKRELAGLFEDYRMGILNHIVPLKYLDILTKKHELNYLQVQYYFNPYPKELKLLKAI